VVSGQWSEEGQVTSDRWPLTTDDSLSLPLLVTRVGLADYPQHAVAADDDAMLTDTLDRGTNFHEKPPGSNLLTTPRFDLID